MGFWVGCLNAKTDLTSSEMVGNESEINKRNDNFNNNFNCSLFLISMYSSYDKKRNHHEYLRLNRKWHNLNLLKSEGKSPPSPSPCAVPALYLVLDIRQSVNLRQMPLIRFSVEKFKILELCCLVFLNCVYNLWYRSVLFYVDHLNQESLLQWKK